MAYQWLYGKEKRYYVWSETDYWKLNTGRDGLKRIEVDYPRKIDKNWKRVPKTVTAAFTLEKGLFLKNEIYFYFYIKELVKMICNKPRV